MNFKFMMIGAAALALSATAASAFAQDTPNTPSPANQTATPMPAPTTDQPAGPTTNEPAMTPDEPGMSKPAETMTKPSYGTGWDAKKCAAAEQKGKADPANCPKMEPKG